MKTNGPQQHKVLSSMPRGTGQQHRKYFYNHCMAVHLWDWMFDGECCECGWTHVWLSTSAGNSHGCLHQLHSTWASVHYVSAYTCILSWQSTNWYWWILARSTSVNGVILQTTWVVSVKISFWHDKTSQSDVFFTKTTQAITQTVGNHVHVLYCTIWKWGCGSQPIRMQDYSSKSWMGRMLNWFV